MHPHAPCDTAADHSSFAFLGCLLPCKAPDGRVILVKVQQQGAHLSGRQAASLAVEHASASTDPTESDALASVKVSTMTWQLQSGSRPAVTTLAWLAANCALFLHVVHALAVLEKRPGLK